MQKKPRGRFSGGRLIVYLVLLLGCVITLAPFLWMVLTAMKTQVEAVSIPPSILPKHWDISSFLILPQYLTIQKMGLLNTLRAIFLPNLFSAFGTFLMRQFFMAIPQELEDAACIDGCSHGRIFLQVMLPLVKPGLVSLGVLTLRFAWNNLMWPMIVNTSPEKMTLAAGLSYLQGQYLTDYPSIMAGALLSIIPLIIIYAIFQKQFIEGIALTGIKG